MQLLLYIIIYPILWFLSILPTRVLYAFSTFIFFWVYHVFGYRRTVVKYNLNLCFPEKTEKEIGSIEKKFYQHLCDMLVESIRSISISEAEMKRRFKFTNIEEVHEVEKANKSIMLMCAHYASWEWIFILQKYVSFDGYAIYKRIENKYFDRLVRKIRAKYNTYLITNRQAIFKIRKLQSENKMATYGFLSDQSPKVNSARHWQKFMNINVPVYTGAEVMAKEMDMAVMFFFTKKVKRGYYETTFKTVTLNPREFDDYQITDMFIEQLENVIRETPEYYLWTHKRWKHKDQTPVKFEKNVY